ncbi:DUF5667 domain-containing protein [Chloroflexota bacterium]
MRKHRGFDNALDECLERLLTGGTTIEQCLQSFPEQADALKPLLETALATKGTIAIQPGPEFRDKARYQFYSALRETEHKKSRPLFSWRWQSRWATVVAAVLALLLAGGGTVTAASGSMPDEPLYTVKLITEQARLVLTPSTLGKAELYARLADKRVAEIVHMASKNKPEQIEMTTRRLDAYLVSIAVLSSTQQVKSEAIMAPAARETLTVEEAPLPAPSAVVVRETFPGLDRRAKLREIMALHASKNPDRLRASLKAAPESARPALLQAIAVSEAGYEKALESLEQP